MSGFNTGSDLDIEKVQDAFTVVNARVGIRGPGNSWSVELWAQNLFDEDFMVLCVLYFGMNYLLLGSVFLSIGAQASTAREVQVLSMPVTFAQVLIFGFAAISIGAPDTPLAILGAVFPLSSPLVMVARAAERPELWPHLLALGWQALWVGLIVVASARLFRRTVLKSGPVRRSWWRRAAA